MEFYINPVTLPEMDADARSFSRRCRSENIRSFGELVTSIGDEYGYDSLERCVLVHTTSSGESVYIRFPGMETSSSHPNELDFRPVVVGSDGSVSRDYSMGDLWTGFGYMATRCEACIRLLGYALYRMMAFSDHTVRKIGGAVVDVPSTSEGARPTVEVDVWIYSSEAMEDAMMDGVDSVVEDVFGMSMEALLVYVDLLCQNDDCKYHGAGLGTGDQRRGRPNALKTHIAVLGMLAGVLPVGDLLYAFTIGRGVVNMSDDAALTIATNLVSL